MGGNGSTHIHSTRRGQRKADALDLGVSYSFFNTVFGFPCEALALFAFEYLVRVAVPAGTSSVPDGA